eukprot:26725-Pyramimonas_sp.AAC.2
MLANPENYTSDQIMWAQHGVLLPTVLDIDAYGDHIGERDSSESESERGPCDVDDDFDPLDDDSGDPFDDDDEDGDPFDADGDDGE